MKLSFFLVTVNSLSFTVTVMFLLTSVESSPFGPFTVTTLPFTSIVTFFALIISTVLNAIYFIHTMITIYSRNEEHYQYKPVRDIPFVTSTILMVALNILLGVIPATVVHVLTHGISNFF